jgi:twinkle protein
VDGPAVSRQITPEVEAFARKRGISRTTLERLRVGSVTAAYRDLNWATRPSIAFNYFGAGDDGPTFWKARPADGEKAFTAMKGGKISFYNLDAVLAGDLKMVFITEGEFDAAALVEAGVPVEYVLSVPAGASEPKTDDAERAEERRQQGYGYVKDALSAGLNRARKFIYCGEADGPGRNLRQDLVAILGAANFYFIDWPEGCTDANAYLLSDGPEALRELVRDGALPWPVDGLFRLSELPEPPPLTLWKPGFPEWESKVRLARGTFSVVTGQPGHGKTALWTQIWFQVVRGYDVPIFVCSFETRAKPHMRRTLRTLCSGRLERDMDDRQIATADRWIDERYLWGYHPQDKPDLKWWLDMAEVAIVRHGAQVVQLDPWNRLETQRDGRKETETDYIGRCLTEIYSFAQQMNAHVQILAHPAKMDGKARGRPPELEDISGSKHWENRVDQGFVVHRKKIIDGGQRCTEATLFHRKARFDDLGHPCQLNLDFDLSCGRYRSTDYDVGGYGK